MASALLSAMLLLAAGCGFRHCTELAANRDDTKAALCEAKAQCRCMPPENFEPLKQPDKD